MCYMVQCYFTQWSYFDINLWKETIANLSIYSNLLFNQIPTNFEFGDFPAPLVIPTLPSIRNPRADTWKAKAGSLLDNFSCNSPPTHSQVFWLASGTHCNLVHFGMLYKHIHRPLIPNLTISFMNIGHFLLKSLDTFRHYSVVFMKFYDTIHIIHWSFQITQGVLWQILICPWPILS